MVASSVNDCNDRDNFLLVMIRSHGRNFYTCLNISRLWYIICIMHIMAYNIHVFACGVHAISHDQSMSHPQSQSVGTTFTGHTCGEFEN